MKEEYDLSENQKDNKQYLEESMEVIPNQFEVLEGGLMPNAILDYIDDHDFDLLVMMNRKHSFMERLLWPQNIDQIGFHTKIPFLVIPDSAGIAK